MSRSAATTIAVLAAIAPTLAVAQFRALALVTTLGLAAAVLAHRRTAGAWPWPRPTGPVLAACLALLAWLGISAFWAAEPGRVLATAAALAAFAALGAAAARVAATSPLPPWFGIALPVGVAAAAVLAAVDQWSGHALRAAIRFIEPAPWLGFGLKPAISVIAVLLPLALFHAAGPRWRWAVALPPALLAAWIVPAEAAKLAVLAGLATALATAAFGCRTIRILAGATAALVVAMPLLTAVLLQRLPPLETWPPSATHRVLIWDFVIDRIAERPLTGWGGEATRTIPGGRDTFDATALARFGIDSAERRDWFARPAAQRLPLHTHNVALQLWLELGAVGALLAATLVWALGAAAARSAAPAAAAGAFAAAVTVGGLSYGAWQEWWWGLLILLCCVLAPRRAPRATA